VYAVSSRLIRIRETPGKVPGNVLLAGWRLLPTSRLERSRCAADAFACAGPVVEVMI